MTSILPPVIGVDLGGTNVRAAVVWDGSRVGPAVRLGSVGDGPAEATLAAIVQVCRDAAEAAEVSLPEVGGIGIGLPGIMDTESGVCFWSPNFPAWKDVPIAAAVQHSTGRPVFILNDGKCAGLGELRAGAGRGVRNLVMITLGTGIGGAFVVDGRLLIGPNGSVGEVGHHTIDVNGPRCGCGNFGCWEALCARDAIIDRADRKLQSGRPSSLRDQATALTPRSIATAAMAGDALACEVMEEVGFYIGVGVANLINLLNPERFVIGGGISQAGDLLFGPIRRTVESRAVALQRATARIVPAELGDNAGVVGAAALALDRIGAG